MDKNKISEEVTVTPVIKDIERLFVKGYRFFLWLLTSCWEFLVRIVQLVFSRFVWFAIVVIAGGAIGFFSTQFIPRQYASEMILQLNVDSREQLFNDVNTINAFISSDQNEKVKTIFNLTDEEIDALGNCSISPYSSYTEKTLALNDLYENTDTAVFNQLDFPALLSPNGVELSSKFKIIFTATEPTIFEKLEAPFLSYIEQSEELKIMLETSRASLIEKKRIYLDKMDQLDTLSTVYNKALLAQAENGNSNSGSNTTIEFGEAQAQRQMNALDIQDRHLFYAHRVQAIEKTLAASNTAYFVKGHLNPIGNKIGYGPLARAVLLAGICFVLLALYFLIKQMPAKEV